jgi:(E)-4-hydroxy-3-methylbut-2-enyl-diphosphate synthase
MTIEAYRLLADKVDYPFHLGVTEAGTPITSVRSSRRLGQGLFAAEGIGDTIPRFTGLRILWRKCVSAPIFLRALGLKKDGMTFIACPSCGRADVDLLVWLAVEEPMIPYRNLNIHVVVMVASEWA